MNDKFITKSINECSDKTSSLIYRISFESTKIYPSPPKKHKKLEKYQI